MLMRLPHRKALKHPRMRGEKLDECAEGALDDRGTF